jgi:hypothetical protein
MSIFKLNLKREDNTQFYEIIDGYNAILADWNLVNNKLHKLKQAKIFIIQTSRSIRSLIPIMEKLQIDYLHWLEKASALDGKPSFVFDSV